jgi:hypothetical protein
MQIHKKLKISKNLNKLNIIYKNLYIQKRKEYYSELRIEEIF